jgi:2'-5' RNA ligase
VSPVSGGALRTLPDYLAPGLDIIFVGINPSIPSARQGHYYANPRNRFWRAFNLAELTSEPLGPETDHRVLEFGMGFTDLVKRPSAGVADLVAADFREGAAVLAEKLARYRPRLVCFQGVMVYQRYLRYTVGLVGKVALGVQGMSSGDSRHFVAPNPSPANAAVSLEALVDWYRRLKEELRGLGQREEGVRAFVAVELPEAARLALGRLVEALRRAPLERLRPVNPEGIHLTLKFLGNVAVSRLPQVMAAMDQAAARAGPMEVELRGLGGFPNLGSPRVLWVGIQGDTAQLRALAMALEERLVAAGFPAESRPFAPHLTLARMRDGATPEERRQAGETLQRLAGQEVAALPVTGISLMRSELRPQGARYTLLHHAPLGGG